MLTCNHINLDQRLAVGLALTFTLEFLPLFEIKCPTDFRPRQALMTAMKWLQGEATAVECLDAARAAQDANHVAKAAAYTAYAAVYGSDSADYAKYVVTTISWVYIANYSAKAIAAPFSQKQYIHNILLQLLPLILDYKIEHQQKFGRPEEVFEYLSETDRDKFLFNLDILV